MTHCEFELGQIELHPGRIEFELGWIEFDFRRFEWLIGWLKWAALALGLTEIVRNFESECGEDGLVGAVSNRDRCREKRSYKPHPIPANLMMTRNLVISAWMPKSLALDGNQPTHKYTEFLHAHRLPSYSQFEPKQPEHTVIPAWMPESSVQGWQTVGYINL